MTLDSGAKIEYGALVSTMPLDLTLTWLGKEDWAKGLQHSSSHIVGFGIRGACPHGLKCWLYFPEDNCPFYRCVCVCGGGRRSPSVRGVKGGGGRGT